MSVRAALSRDDIVLMLAAFGNRTPAMVDDVVRSLDLAWLIAEVEKRYDVMLDLSVEQLDSVRTVDDAVRILGDAVTHASSDGMNNAVVARQSAGSEQR